MAESEQELKSLLMKKRVKKLAKNSTFKKIKIMVSGPITSWQRDGETMQTVTDFLFLAPKSPWTVTTAMILKDICSLEENDKPQQHIKKQRCYFANKVRSSHSYGS